MLRKWNDRTVALVIALVSAAAPLYACGPHLPNRVLFEDYALKVPRGSFYKELERIKPPLESEFAAMLPIFNRKYSAIRRYGEQTESGDIGDLKAALAGLDVGESQRGSILASYGSMRKQITEYLRERLNWQQGQQWAWRRDRTSVGPYFNPPKVPKGLPGEFDDYIAGAISYHSGDANEAIAAWRRLLDRPAGQRKYKSTWAAYMIGKALLKSDPGESVKWFARVRELALGGFEDSIGLAASSLGWEARAELNRGNQIRAVELYLAQTSTGDRAAGQSVFIAGAALLRAEPEVLEQAALNEPVRKVLTAYVASNLGPQPNYAAGYARRARAWLDAIESAGVDSVADADRLALAAYGAGDMETAAKWLRIAAEDSTMARWLRAKLLLRAGKVDEAAEQLHLAARGFAPAVNEQNRGYGSFYGHAGMNMSVDPMAQSMRGELGVLYLSRRQYVEALDVLLAGGHWEDAAYVAERVLTPQELTEYVDRVWPDDTDPAAGEEMRSRLDRMRTRVRYLLARRLARLGRWDDARAYYPPKWRGRFDIYTQALRDGSNRDLPEAARAEALWKAAIIARHEGIELLGTEVEPDWFIYKGQLSLRPLSAIRAKIEPGRVLQSTTDEVRRVRQHVAVPNVRWHYRYTATQHAWRAAELMPDNSNETARILCIAGSWLQARDNKGADRFYKELVVRCPNTRLGREAEKRRWFPMIAMDRKQLLEETQ